MSTLNWVYKTYSFRWRGSMKLFFDSVHFQLLAHFFFSFSWQIIHLTNVDVYTFWGVWGVVWESVCFVHSFKCWQFWTNPNTKRKPYGWQVCEEGLLGLWPQPYHPRPEAEGDAAGVTTRGVHPHAPVNHMVFFLCHGFIKFMYINKILMKTRL